MIKSNECLEDLQCNNLFIIQEKEGYRFTSDAVALANFVRVKPNGKVVDLCSGSGVIGILVSAKNPVSYTYLVEIQSNLADMSKRTIEHNGLDNVFSVVNKPLQDIHKEIGVGTFDVVVCNPPYKKSGTATNIGAIDTISIAKHEITVTLEDIIREAGKLLKFGGDFYIVNKEERLVDMMCIMRKYQLEPKELKILPSTKGASVVMLKARKGGKSGLKISL
ncbi:MAG: SAM-dependent methyltransferase [Clostridiales bacterium]|nr:SAM-dependent methyltransferase [Clostridiales bacterium]